MRALLLEISIIVVGEELTLISSIVNTLRLLVYPLGWV
jgi:hypothetical protein